MALTVDSLSVWDIGFRWANLDPDSLWLRLPMPVKDNFRLLMEAILAGEILCETLTLAKRPSDSKADPRFYIRSYIDAVHDCIAGQSYNRKLLRWATISRMDFMEWCENRGIPEPEFWFPPGWKLHFEMPEGGTTALRAEHVEPESEVSVEIHYNIPDLHPREKSISRESNKQKLTANQEARIACQQIARNIWKSEPERTIASIVKDDLIQKYGGAGPYADDTVRGWIKKVAPLSVKSRRGRPKKNGYD